MFASSVRRLRGAGWIVVLLVGVAGGCASGGKRSVERIAELGGVDGLHAIMVETVERSADDPRIGRFFEQADLVNLADRLTEQVCADLGGPCDYSGLPMRDAHFALDIHEADFNRMVEILQDVMEARSIPQAAQNAVLAHLAGHRHEVIHQ